jgi:hypothetical protein
MINSCERSWGPQVSSVIESPIGVIRHTPVCPAWPPPSEDAPPPSLDAPESARSDASGPASRPEPETPDEDPELPLPDELPEPVPDEVPDVPVKALPELPLETLPELPLEALPELPALPPRGVSGAGDHQACGEESHERKTRKDVQDFTNEVCIHPLRTSSDKSA